MPFDCYSVARIALAYARSGGGRHRHGLLLNMRANGLGGRCQRQRFGLFTQSDALGAHDAHIGDAKKPITVRR